jgi:hypothetical protein
MAPTCGTTVVSLLETGKITKCTGMDFLPGPMVVSTRVNISMIRRKATVSLFGLMDGNTTETG